MTVTSEDIEYGFEGLRLVGELSVDGAVPGARPGVLVCHEGGGLTDRAKNVARRLAGLGYVAFALDYYGDGQPVPSEVVMDRLGPLMGDPLATRAIATAGLDTLLADPRVDRSRVAAIGFCFGGTMSLELARAAPTWPASWGSTAASGRPARRTPATSRPTCWSASAARTP